MDPLSLSLAMSGVKALKGFKQQQAAKKIGIKDRKLSDERLRAAKDIQARATSGKFAGQDIQEEKQQGQIADLLRKGQSSGSPSEQSALVAQAMQSTTANTRANQEKALRERQTKQAAATSSLESIGAEKEAIAQEKRQEAIAAKQALQKAGTENIVGGLSDAAGAAALDYDDEGGTGETGSGEENRMFQKRGNRRTRRKPRRTY